MRLAQVESLGFAGAAVQHAGRWHPMASATLDALVAAGRAAIDEAAHAALASEPLQSPRFRAPLVPGKIVAVGLNYLDHIRESGLEAPSAPLLFAKLPSSVIGPDDAIRIDPRLTQRVDWEVELAVVIGRRLHRAEAQEALDAVLGYTVGNDVSARDLQFGDGQWLRGKSLDTFCPLGPVIVTADEFGDPREARLATRVNGRTMQDSSTAEMIFGVAEILVHCSQAFTLLPGDVILTGTPWGCGEFMTPRRLLSPGDVVETEVEGIGVLRNPVERAA